MPNCVSLGRPLGGRPGGSPRTSMGWDMTHRGRHRSYQGRPRTPRGRPNCPADVHGTVDALWTQQCYRLWLVEMGLSICRFEKGFHNLHDSSDNGINRRGEIAFFSKGSRRCGSGLKFLTRPWFTYVHKKWGVGKFRCIQRNRFLAAMFFWHLSSCCPSLTTHKQTTSLCYLWKHNCDSLLRYIF